MTRPPAQPDEGPERPSAADSVGGSGSVEASGAEAWAHSVAGESARNADGDREQGEAGDGTGQPPLDRALHVAAAVRTWQRHLVDLGGRNTLLWYRDLPSGTLDLTTAHPGGLAMLLAGRPTRLTDLFREPSALADARQRARTVRAKAIELREERGITTGFLAVGMATWRVAGATRPPVAPVLLRSCVLSPRDVAHEDFEVDLGEEVELNPVLEHYLRSERGIELDAVALAELATVTGGFDPAPAYSALMRVCESLPDFAIAARLVVATFSYAKLPMVADLGAQGSALAGHDVVAALAGDPEACAALRTTLPESEPEIDPRREHLVLDADSSQLAVIEAVRQGAHLVVQGPPGTGKSQTIANLVASLVGAGKRVLFVAEKRAAIDTVLDRLQAVGLRDLVLDAHEGAADRRGMMRELGAALDRNDSVTGPDMAAAEHTLTDRRSTLVDHLTALHERRGPWGVSAYEAQTALVALSHGDVVPTSRVRVRSEALRPLTRPRLEALRGALAEAASLGAWTVGAGDDPWYAARVASPDEASKALDTCRRLSGGGLASARRELDDVLRSAALPQATTASDWASSLALVLAVQETLEVFRADVFAVPLADFCAATASRAYRRQHAISLGWFARARLRRQARRLLRPGPPPSDLHERLRAAQEQRVAWQHLAGGGARPEVPAEIDTAHATYAALAADLSWLGERLSSTAKGGDLLGTSLDELQQRLAQLASRADRLAVVPQVTRLLDELRTAGLGPLVDDMAARGVTVEHVGAELDHVWWTSILDDITARDPRYGAHDGDGLRTVVSDYVAADHAHLDGTAARIRADVARRLREVLAEHSEQEALLRVEAAKERRHSRLRELLPRAGEPLTAAKPCWAMSPLVVASLLPPGRWFDVVIFDEASQIACAEAVSAISRAAQVVVVGDERQLPPTSFLTAAVDDAAAGAPPDLSGPTEAVADGSESVLAALSATLPVRRLTCHYRSMDERLVAFPNQAMYDGSLLTFPGTAGSVEPAITLEVVDGVAPVRPGKEAIESTDAEVDRVVELVLEHARLRAEESLGVITLGLRHASRIEDALSRALTGARDVHGFFDDDRPERFFVKNLERVQGDERDAVILSVGFGRTPHGRILHRFGSLNLEGGARRLNVAVTRARRRMTVVSAFRGSDLDESRLKAAGARMLRAFLLYAEAGDASPVVAAKGGESPVGMESAASSPVGDDDPLVADFASRLRQEGLVVHQPYGHGPRPIDLAVEDPYHPGRVLLAVETDGRLYAATPSTRDRDRLRPEHLGRLGWVYTRVWSTDLFRDPARDVSRVTALAHSAASAAADRWEKEGPDRGLGAPGPAQHTAPARPGEHVEQPAEQVEHAAPGERFEHAATGQQVEQGVSGTAPLEQTTDDTDAGWGERREDSGHDDWLREQRPPHWG